MSNEVEFSWYFECLYGKYQGDKMSRLLNILRFVLCNNKLKLLPFLVN